MKHVIVIQKLDTVIQCPVQDTLSTMEPFLLAKLLFNFNPDHTYDICILSNMSSQYNNICIRFITLNELNELGNKYATVHRIMWGGCLEQIVNRSAQETSLLFAHLHNWNSTTSNKYYIHTDNRFMPDTALSYGNALHAINTYNATLFTQCAANHIVHTSQFNTVIFAPLYAIINKYTCTQLPYNDMPKYKLSFITRGMNYSDAYRIAYASGVLNYYHKDACIIGRIDDKIIQNINVADVGHYKSPTFSKVIESLNMCALATFVVGEQSYNKSKLLPNRVAEAIMANVIPIIDYNLLCDAHQLPEYCIDELTFICAHDAYHIIDNMCIEKHKLIINALHEWLNLSTLNLVDTIYNCINENI
jgi:hypothetical protein